MSRQSRQGTIDIQVAVNAQELSKQIRKLGSGGADLRRALRAAGKEAAQIIADDAKKRVPVGSYPKRGQRLRDTIKPRITSSRVAVKAGSKKNFHAIFVHDGHKKRGSRRGQGHGWVRGTPFLDDAIEAKRREFFAAYEKQINKIVEEFNRRR